MSVAIARVYERRQPGRPQHRVLVDRLSPRGLSKDLADLDWWARDVAPSSELRRWYGHDPARFDEFADRCGAELSQATAAGALVQLPVHLAGYHGPVVIEEARQHPLGVRTLASRLRNRLVHDNAV